MKKFSFPLQFLLDYRKRREDKLKKELAGVIEEENQEKMILTRLRKKMALCQEELYSKESNGMELAMVLLYYSYMEKLIAQISEQKRKIEKIARKREKIREELLKASQEKKLMEKIREKRWARFIYLKGKLEQQLIDESAISRFHHKTES